MPAIALGLGEVELALARLVKTDPARASRLYETFLAGAFEKVNELDDSSGNLGMFVDQLLCGWIKRVSKQVSHPTTRPRGCFTG